MLWRLCLKKGTLQKGKTYTFEIITTRDKKQKESVTSNPPRGTGVGGCFWMGLIYPVHFPSVETSAPPLLLSPASQTGAVWRPIPCCLSPALSVPGARACWGPIALLSLSLSSCISEPQNILDWLRPSGSLSSEMEEESGGEGEIEIERERDREREREHEAKKKTWRSDWQIDGLQYGIHTRLVNVKVYLFL